MTVSSTTNRVSYTGNDSTDTYNYTFRIFANTDLLVIVKNTTTDVETTLTLTTDYTVTGVGGSGGTIVLAGSGKAWQGTGANLNTGYKLYIRRVLPLKQLTDIRNQGDFYPEVHEDALDKLIMIEQQQQDELDRAVKLSETIDPADFDATIPADAVGAASMSLVINATGDGFDVGPTTTEISNAQTYAEASDASATLAEEWASKTDGIVDSTDYSAKAYAIGGTGVSDTAGKGAAKEWAIETSGTVDGTDYSAKEHAIGTQTRGASGGGSAKDWASYTGGTVDDTSYSAKQYAADAAQSAIDAADAAATSQWSDVVYVTFADSPVSIVDADSGKLYSVDTSSGNVVFNLPAISGLTLSQPWVIGVKKSTNDANTVTINRNGTDVFDELDTSVVLSGYRQGRNLIPDTDATPDSWTTIEFNEKLISGSYVGTTDTQTLTNKTFDDSITMQELGSTPSTPASGYKKIYPKNDGKVYALDDAGNEIELGSGGLGDADTIHLIQAEDMLLISEADLTGNNADFDGGGTITSSSLSLSTTSADLIKGDQVIKYSPGADGSDDYFGFTKVIPIGLRGRFLGFSFEYKNSSTVVDDDFRFAVKQKDGTLAGNIEYFNMEAFYNASGNSHLFSVAAYIAEDCTEIEFGWQNTSTTTTVQLFVDNILVSSKASISSNLLDTHNLKYSEDTSAMQDRTAGEHRFSTSLTTSSFNTSGPLYVEDDSGNTRTKFVASKACDGVISYSGPVSGSSTQPYIYKNGSLITEGSTSGASTNHTSTSVPFHLEAGEYLTVGSSTSWETSGTAYINILAFAETEHVATPANSGTEFFATASHEVASFWDGTGSQYTFDISLIPLTNSKLVEWNDTTQTRLVAKQDINLDVSITGDLVSGNALFIYNSSGTRISWVYSLGGGAPFTATANIQLDQGDYVYFWGTSLTSATGGINVRASRINASLITAVPVPLTAFVKDAKSSATDGGTFTSGSFQTRDLNDLSGDTSFISLASNQFTLQPGKYKINGKCPAFRVEQHKAKLVEDPSGTPADAIIGTSEISTSTANTTNFSYIDGVIEITTATTYEVQHRCSNTVSTNGLGYAVGYGVDEIYTTIEITKIK